MDHKKDTLECGMGILPAKAPLANVYVPFQVDKPPMYEPNKALIRGTMYPGLDLPFMGMVNKKEKPETPKTVLQTIGFAIQELALYLDTHPQDAEALQLYRAYQKLHHEKAEEYAKICGPMTHQAPSGSKQYDWLDDPWPWEYAANKEG